MTTTASLAHGSLTDIAGLRVGHYHRSGRGWLTGTTVVLTPPGTVGGVDVRGGGPGTCETDLLRPENLVSHVNAICLTGGSAYGLAAATGVMDLLAERHVGYPVGPEPYQVVPIVPAAVIFDLGRGEPRRGETDGRFEHRPDASFGRLAAERSTGRMTGRVADRVTGRVASEGSIGAGTGARAGGLRGGVGMASMRMPDGTMVAALAVVNAVGMVIDPSTALPWFADPALRLRKPNRSEREALRAVVLPEQPPLNTTIGIVATDARLDKAECTKLAQTAHDGLARSVRPAHSMFDGDTIFALATGARELPVPDDDQGRFGSPTSRPGELSRLIAAVTECFAIAVTRGVVLAATGGRVPSYRDLCPSAFG